VAGRLAAVENLGMSALGQAFRGKRVLVTGHTGFKGSWLCLCLVRAGAKVCGYSLPSRTDRDNFVQSGLENRVEHHVGDIRDLKELTSVVGAFRPEVAFHLAAQALVKRSYANPVETFGVNVLGTVHVLEALRAAPECRATVAITSDKCYENLEWAWGYRETDRLGGHDPYSASKGAAEIAAAAYRRSFFLPDGRGLATARAGNVIGGGDWSPDRLIPDCIRALQCGEPVVLRQPGATRPWQHVLEPVSGYLRLAEALMQNPTQFSEAWNFGPDPARVFTVQQVVDLVVRCWGRGRWEISGERSPHEAGLLALDISKARQRLGWRPVWDTRRAVEQTVRWYRDGQDGKAYEVCLRQIEEYEREGDATHD
jgi:CDP-glucose 4,6-dehydratase